ncbi:threonine--tRNA ligase [Rickettsiella endosymbiont of Dermanyssus gallinae]|uniref:threonine--tRNA ligase n=1 Tax=Rickettsiella endosymbiont of Dermanyssus gallinae TaxID=2856608 RepID=UPI001C531EEF|nr:threonine--tRNA ligase [Rickettsiella endosymbiont of Dermanyssus gallinae]
MPVITLPDSKQLTFSEPTTAYQVAADISPGLARNAIAAAVDGQLVDLSYVIESDVALRILTERDTESLEVIRHSTAHLLAHAVKQLFPQAQVTIGPVIENGFYYDFAFERPFTPDDLKQIEKRMQELVKQALPVKRFTLSRTEAIELFRKMGEEYKAKIIEDIPEGEVLSLYQEGDFVDLCRGPHVPNTSKLKVFKLTRVAGAYWRGDAKNEMLQRIYGTAWFTKDDLNAYLQRIEEAEKRDHRKLGKQLELFHIQEEAPGMIFWHPKGWSIYQIIEQYIRKRLEKCGYQEIRTPQLLARQLWERSGHWDKFFNEMFTTRASENTEFAIKPMSCPGHVLVFNQGLKSYRDLPLRFAEFGCCHRNEPSGALHGLMRVRGFTQDDGHIFCTEEQIQSEVAAFIDQLYAVYADFGFNEILIKLATRPDLRVGNDENWDKAEQALAQALDGKALKWQYLPGEGAFYGPKIEFTLEDCLGRTWQCGTIQVDFSTPGRLGAEYTTEQGERKTPVMLHRAILGSFERFIAILIEHYAGHFPVWLAPIQAVVMTITDKQNDYAEAVAQELESLGFRIKLDLRNEKIGYKIREHSLQKVPYQLIIGDKEVQAKQVNVRRQGGGNLGSMSPPQPLSMSVREFEKMVKGEGLEQCRIDEAEK